MGYTHYLSAKAPLSQTEYKAIEKACVALLMKIPAEQLKDMLDQHKPDDYPDSG